jgi:sugar lactone lactonase YvrE
MVLIGDLLYAVERDAVAEIDVRSGSILRRIALPEPGFPNDVAADDRGILYVTDSSKGAIYRLSGDAFEEWIRKGELQDPNALFVRGVDLLVGNSGDNCLKAIDLETGAIRSVIHLGPGVIDGIKENETGDLLVSHWEGRLFRIRDGVATKVLDTSAPGRNCADFEYISGKRLVVIPTFYDNRVAAYRIAP